MISKCPYCGDSNIFTYFYVDRMPTILSACDKDLASKVRTHPLRAMACGNCWLGFNAIPLDEKQYKEIYDDYLYISPMNGIGQSKYGNILKTIKWACHQRDRIVDVGCADGYLLHQLRQFGFMNLKGIEPSILSLKGLSDGLDIINGYFSPELFEDGSVDCFVMMHVFEHFSDPFTILKDMKRKLSFDGKIIMEVPYFSGEHHQHLYFYNITFMRRLCADLGLEINLAEIDQDTESLRLVMSRVKNNFDSEIMERPVDILDICLRKNKDNQEKINRIDEIIRKGKGVVWWGAGSTSVIFLNQIDHEMMRFITVVDGDKNKWGLYIPVINEKVYPYTICANRVWDDLIVASSFASEIKETMRLNDIRVNNMEIFV